MNRNLTCTAPAPELWGITFTPTRCMYCDAQIVPGAPRDCTARRKAAFLTEYRSLCERLGLMVLKIDVAEYSPFALAELDAPTLDRAMLELQLEPIRVVRHERAG